MTAADRLSPVEARVLGSLLEKANTTPEYYPLSLNALTLACNQKSNREPVLELDEMTVAHAVDALLKKQLVYESAGGRVRKYGENFTKLRHLIKPETAALCMLLLRGPQTMGELKGRTGRMHEWQDLAEVEATLGNLIDHQLAVKLPRPAGRKEHRYAHLLSGAPEVETEGAAARPAPAMAAARAESERMGALEEELKAVRAELEELRNAFVDFKRQFD